MRRIIQKYHMIYSTVKMLKHVLFTVLALVRFCMRVRNVGVHIPRKNAIMCILGTREGNLGAVAQLNAVSHALVVGKVDVNLYIDVRRSIVQ